MINGRELIAYVSFHNEGRWEDIYDFIKQKKPVDKDEVKDISNKLNSEYVTLLDEKYPNVFKKKLSKPPFTLFYKGDYSLILDSKYKRLSIVGSRKATKYGIESVKKIIRELPSNYVIISGLAYGIDSIAHQTALECGLKTIAVLGSGINSPYPEVNLSLYNDIVANGGLIISEYPNLTKPQKENFIFRNRIIACLGDFLVVGEAYERSGTSTTISYALQCGNNVGCIPYPIGTNSMCNTYIKEGAYLIDSGKEIINIMNNESGSY